MLPASRLKATFKFLARLVQTSRNKVLLRMKISKLTPVIQTLTLSTEMLWTLWWALLISNCIRSINTKTAILTPKVIINTSVNYKMKLFKRQTDTRVTCKHMDSSEMTTTIYLISVGRPLTALLDKTMERVTSCLTSIKIWIISHPSLYLLILRLWSLAIWMQSWPVIQT